MSLTLCPDCEKQISDLAKSCPNCGRPRSDAELYQRSRQTPLPIEHTGKQLKLARIASLVVIWISVIVIIFADASKLLIYYNAGMTLCIGVIWYYTIKVKIWWHHK